jgi:virginiamycin B lyase
MKIYLVAFLGFFVAGPLASAPAPIGIDGTASLSGVVSAPRSFKAAQVHAKNVDKRMLYMVYTKDGRYRAINLMPGNYQVWVEKEGFEPAPVQQVQIEAGDRLQLDFSLKEGAPVQMSVGGPTTTKVPLVPYEQLYPDGPGLAVAERLCIVCHGENFIPRFHKTTEQWDRTNRWHMRPEKVLIGLTPEERTVLAQYLGEHFGPDSETRALKFDVEIPLDEEALSTAMFIEYFIPEGRQAEDVAFDLDGNVWYADNGNFKHPTRIGKLDPSTALITQYDLPVPDSYPEGIVVDARGLVFWSEPGGGVLGRLDPRTGKIDRFPHGVPYARLHTPFVDENEDVWFTMIVGDRIGKWDRETEKIQVWEVPRPNAMPYGGMARDGRIWFAEWFGVGVGMFDAKTERFTEYPTLVQPASMRRVAVDADGTTVWYGIFNQGKLGKLDIKTGERVEYDLLPGIGPSGVGVDPDGAVWVSDVVLGGEMIRFDPETEESIYYPWPRRVTGMAHGEVKGTGEGSKLDITREGAIWYNTHLNKEVTLGVLWPDVSKMTGFAANR